MRIIVTGGAGFIGSAVIRYLIADSEHTLINVDKLTYAGNLQALDKIEAHPRYKFVRADICDKRAMNELFHAFKPDAVMHLAAESHVDRSIDGPADFIQTNIVGTFNLLDISRQYWTQLGDEQRSGFRFHHISTDEVYGDLHDNNALFTETTPYAPSSPYSASKASSDHLVRAWGRTYGLPVLITNCSNNYGPYQYPEKLIPLMILNALKGKPLPIYGNGHQIRDWLFVDDHARALRLVLEKGKIGSTYNIGGLNERRNIDVVKLICELIEERQLRKPEGVEQYSQLITYVNDRPGHDLRYAIDATKIATELGWQPAETFESGIAKTINWYLENLEWATAVQAENIQRKHVGAKS